MSFIKWKKRYCLLPGFAFYETRNTDTSLTMAGLLYQWLSCIKWTSNGVFDIPYLWDSATFSCFVFHVPRTIVLQFLVSPSFRIWPSLNKKMVLSIVGIPILGTSYAIPASCIVRICNPINTIIKNVLLYLQILKSDNYGYQESYNRRSVFCYRYGSRLGGSSFSSAVDFAGEKGLVNIEPSW